MGTPASALGGALGGAGSLIGAVGNLLPQGSTTKGRTSVSSQATSDTQGSQVEMGGSSSNTNTNSNTFNQNSGSTINNKTNTGSENTSATTSQSTSSNTQTSNVEQFSGQQNVRSQQTMLTDPAVLRIINLALQGDSGIPGLQAIASGERNAGLFNSSTNQLLINNLLTTVGGEVARLSAPTVNSEKIGGTTTTNKGTSQTSTSSITDAVTQAISRASEAATGSSQELGTSRNQTQQTQDVINLLASLASQSTQQQATSETNTKSKTKSGIFGGCFLTTVVVQGFGKADDCFELESLRRFRDGWLAKYHPEEIDNYYLEAPAVVERLKQFSPENFALVISHLYLHYILPVVYFIDAGNFELAYETYKSMVAKAKEV